MATPPHKADVPEQVSSLTGTPQHADRIWHLPLLLLSFSHKPIPFFSNKGKSKSNTGCK